MNLTLANKNPFSTFDFLGYFFPGALFVGLIYLFKNRLPYVSDLCAVPIITALFSVIIDTPGIGFPLLIIICYVAGHAISYMSSVTVEFFYTWCYGYPTRYLLAPRKLGEEAAKKKWLLDSDMGSLGVLAHIIVCVCVLPITIGHIILNRILRFYWFIEKPVDAYMAEGIKNKTIKLLENLGITSSPDTYEKTDIHRIVMHYVYEHCQLHQNKFDNYVALYGFLRSMSLTFCMLFCGLLINYFMVHIQSLCQTQIFWFATVSVLLLLLLLALIFVSKRDNWKECLSENCLNKLMRVSETLFFIIAFVPILFITYCECVVSKLDAQAWDLTMLALSGLSAYLFYLAFAKFYRRFTLENFMALLICDIDIEEKTG